MIVCAYCRTRRAVNRDHVVPRLLRKGYEADGRVVSNEWRKEAIPAEFLGTVGACFTCNHLKGTRRLVPPSWGKWVPALNDFFGGTPFRVWHGDVSEPAFAEVWR